MASEVAQHTPGPWRVGDREPYVEVWGPMKMNAYPILASMECEPRAANARLIAAAPEMLAALWSAEEAVQQLCIGQDPANQCWVVLADIRRTISKAAA